MTIVILAAGSRGDVQPYAALALGLQRAGHRVRLVAPSNFESFVRDLGIDFQPLRADYYALMDSPEGRKLKSGNPVKVMQEMRRTIFPLMRRMFDDAWAATQDAELLVFHPKVFCTPHIAEKLNVPAVAALTLPLLTATSAFPAPGVLTRNLGPFLNRLSYRLVDASTAAFNGMVAEWRESALGLPRQSAVVKGMTMHGQRIPALYNYSEALVPTPPDWTGENHVTGFWFLEGGENWTPPPALEAFLAAGPPPIYIGFGSMVGDDPERLTTAVLEGIQRSGQRAVLASGWGGLRTAALSENIFLLAEAPHAWLFPRVSAVVHHGGAGTTGAGLRAGKPTVICPFLADQPFWGARVAALGAGPAPIPQKRLTAAALSAAIGKAVHDPDMRRKAEALGERLRAEDGVGAAVRILEAKLTHETFSTVRR